MVVAWKLRALVSPNLLLIVALIFSGCTKSSVKEAGSLLSGPENPSVSSPSVATYYSNGSSLVISGTCISGRQIEMTGADSQTFICASSQFSFTVNASLDGTYSYTLKQVDDFGSKSSGVTVQWVRDTVAPNAPTVTAPASSPTYSNSSTFTILGACTTGFLISLSGSDTQSTTCASSSYTFTVSKSTDATYTFSITQSDLAGNASSAVSTQWIRDTVAPSAPTVTTPASSPTYSNSSTFTISGACITGSAVSLSGSDTQSVTCASSVYTFTVSKSTDATYTFAISQSDLAGNASSSVSTQWIRDSVAPSVTGLSSSSVAAKTYTWSWGCDDAAGCTYRYRILTTPSPSPTTTYSSTATASQSSGTATYYIGVQAKDLAGNVSSTFYASAVLDNTAPVSPKFTSPRVSPYLSQGSSLAVSGSCETGATVNLTGAGTQSTTCAASAFSFSVNQGTDGTYDYSISQTDSAGNISSSSSLQWRRLTKAVSSYTSGIIDLNYGPGGAASFGGFGAFANDFGFAQKASVAKQSTGKAIVLNSYSYSPAYFNYYRLTTSGTLDSSFGSTTNYNGGVCPVASCTGQTLVTMGTGNDSVGTSVDVDTSVANLDKIVAAGRVWGGSRDFFAVQRLTANGDKDTTFNSTGYNSLNVGNYNIWTQGVKVLSDSSVLISALASNIGLAATSETQTGVMVLKLNSSGTLDSTFGTSGVATNFFGASAYTVGGVTSYLNTSSGGAIQVQPSNQKILVNGVAYNSGVAQIAVGRFNADGSIDTSYASSSGVAKSAYNGGIVSALAGKFALLSDGSVVVGASVKPTGSVGNRFYLVKFNSSGAVDTSFGTSGIVSTAIGAQSEDNLAGVTSQADGSILAYGSTVAVDGSGTATGNTVQVIVRYNSSGSLDTTFGVNGIWLGTINDTLRNRVYDLLPFSNGTMLALSSTGTNTYYFKLGAILFGF